MEINKIYNENCLDTMSKMPKEFVDMVVTSPPYDDIRNYNNHIKGIQDDFNGYSFPFEKIAKELFRVVKNGGVVVWVVNDAMIKGSESLNSFRQAIYFKEIGFNLHDTMIYRKLNPVPNSGTRYQQMFEYMFVISKGKPKTTNISLRQRSNKCNDKRTFRKKKKWLRNQDGDFTENDYVIKEMVPEYNVWDFYVGGGNTSNDKISFKHPATYPEELAKRHIESWSNEGEIVYDPFMGSGTTAKMSILTKRNYIGSEISEEYCEIIETRLQSSGLTVTTTRLCPSPKGHNKKQEHIMIKCGYRNCSIEFKYKGNKKYCCRNHKQYELIYKKNKSKQDDKKKV